MQSKRFKKAWTTNASTSSFASKVPTITEPTNDGVVALSSYPGGDVPSKVMILPYGLGSDNDVADMRIIGWREIYGDGSLVPLWVPTIIGIFTVTVSAAVGVAASPVLATERFADTITLKTSNLVSQPVNLGTDSGGALGMGSGLEVFSPTGDLIAWIKTPTYGFSKLEFTFDQTTGTPTMNALLAFLD